MKAIHKLTIILAALLLAGCTSFSYHRNGEAVKIRYCHLLQEKTVTARIDLQRGEVNVEALTTSEAGREVLRAYEDLLAKLLVKGSLPGGIQ